MGAKLKKKDLYQAWCLAENKHTFLFCFMWTMHAWMHKHTNTPSCAQQSYLQIHTRHGHTVDIYRELIQRHFLKCIISILDSLWRMQEDNLCCETFQGRVSFRLHTQANVCFLVNLETSVRNVTHPVIQCKNNSSYSQSDFRLYSI